jgi:GGDEF domain-containing protein
VAHRTAELYEANERLTELSYVDPLTGVANRPV